MSLKVTIKDANGNPTTLDVHEMHITSNDANSINVTQAGPAFQQPVGPATAPQPSLNNQEIERLQNIIKNQALQRNDMLKNNAIPSEKLASFNNELQYIDNDFNEKMKNASLTQQDKLAISADSLQKHINNHNINFGDNYMGVQQQSTMYQPAQQNSQQPMYPQQQGQPPPMFQNGQTVVGPSQSQQSNVQYTPTYQGGGSKKRRNKRKKRTRKQRRSRKRSAKR